MRIAGAVMRRYSARRTTLFVVLGSLAAVTVPFTAYGSSALSPAVYDPRTDGGSLSFIAQVVGAQTLWARGITGKGVDVAVIDTGVSPVAGLSQVGKVIDGPDLSFDSQNPAFEHVDGYGHGTMMASIIAGSDVTDPSNSGCATCLTTSTYSDTTKFVGIAPGSRIVNVKTGASDGAADVSQVIAAIDWVVQHRNDHGLNIRVLNLSYGTDSVQPASIDPLSFAVEAAWRSGIVVVVSAGNDGKATDSLADPAYNPTVLAVGALEDNSTLTLKGDSVPAFSQRGRNGRGIDVVVPATHVVGLRVPGSVVDTTFTTGKVGTRFQRGSGTSEAAAVVSGVAALLVETYPTATPDQIKAMITSTARQIGSGNSKSWRFAAGKGVVDASAAGSFATMPTVPGTSWFATGIGTLEGARGTTHLSSNGVELSGEIDSRGSAWDGAAWSKKAASGTAWNGGVWNGVRWSSDTWTGIRWTSAVWAGNDWSGASWAGVRWSDIAWDGIRWSGAGWDGVRWSGASWDGVRWSSSSWN